ncbi:AbfB domain-containing protein [Nonomuraea deserti]|uniref:AbfB domain-containing protein n=1 Tax=Nonomuraea deserti TaxID=1848322 RepID=UPI001FE56E3C|nr:AbfB domain-containing protein [Nonomuraea deserti]
MGSTRYFRRRSDHDLGAGRKRHGSVHNPTAAEETRRAVQSAAGASPCRSAASSPTTCRITTSRHADFDVRIDANVSPAQDASFRLVPGLAHASGSVSFASVNFPGHYLRHHGFDFVLARDDGTATFAADATFRQVAGLAEASWMSLRSDNHPDRYLRHFDHLLRLDPIYDARGRGDTTFLVSAG